jgi:hypothetical protein
VTSNQVVEAEPDASQPLDVGGDDDGDTIFEAPALLKILWADPQNMSEHLALWSLKYFGPRAGRATDRLRGSNPDASVEELEQKAVVHQTRVSMTEGAFVGGPFIVLIPVAFCAALLAQAQMAFEVAAINGYAPTDRMRAADLLVLQGAYGSTDEAGAALDALTRQAKPEKHKRLPKGSRWNMIKKMAYLLGVIGASEDPKPSRFVRVLRWIWLGVTLVGGLVLPLLWVPYMAVAMRRSSIQMGKRATAFYADKKSEEAGVTVTRAARSISVGISAGLIRMVLLIAVPIVLGMVALLTGTDVGTGKWLTAFFGLLLFSLLLTLAYLGYRWLRHRHRTKRRAAAAPGAAA